MELVTLAEKSVPSGATVGAFRGYDGAELRYARWDATRMPRRGTVCLFGGRAEFIEKYFEVVADLRRRGFAVATMDWRGQGGSQRMLANPRKGHVRGFWEYDRDLIRFMKDIVLPDCPPPFIGLAHSMGGNILLRNATMPGLWFERIVLVAPMISIHESILGPRPWHARVYEHEQEARPATATTRNRRPCRQITNDAAPSSTGQATAVARAPIRCGRPRTPVPTSSSRSGSTFGQMGGHAEQRAGRHRPRRWPHSARRRQGGHRRQDPEGDRVGHERERRRLQAEVVEPTAGDHGQRREARLPARAPATTRSRPATRHPAATADHPGEHRTAGNRLVGPRGARSRAASMASFDQPIDS